MLSRIYKSNTVHISLLALMSLLAWHGSSAQSVDQTVGVVMGTNTFSWTFDQAVTNGTFVDGQPWVIRPGGGLHLTATVPTRQNGVVVEGRLGDTNLPPQDINMTVVNPPIADYYNTNGVSLSLPAVFGWDSRGCIRYGVGLSYDASLPWDGTTPLALQVGDAVTTARSLSTGIDATALEAVAVLTVLDAVPPTDAFRPGFTRTAARRAAPEWFRLSDIIDLSPYLIALPTTDLYGQALVNPISTNAGMAMSPARLTALMPGPSIMNSGLNNARASNAMYNNSDATYGATVAQQLGDVAVGALAEWLTPSERELCQIHLIQRAVDTYESLQAGLNLSHNGGHLPGYATLLTIAGRMLNHAGMLGVNEGFNGLPPEFYFSEYSQAFCMVDETAPVGANEPLASSPRRIGFTSPTLDLNLAGATAPAVVGAGASDVTVANGFEWPIYRAAREVQNLKLIVADGAGAGSTVYVVTGIDNYSAAASPFVATNNAALNPIYGGRLTVKPAWQNGTPDATSELIISVAAQDELPRWGFKSGGLNRTVNQVSVYDDKTLSFSPYADYAAINVGAYLTLYTALYALDAETYYKGGLDRWMLQIGTIPGYGEVTFKDSSSRNAADHTVRSGTVDERSFLGGLWRTVTTKPSVNMPFVYTGGGVGSLPVPPDGTRLWQAVASAGDSDGDTIPDSWEIQYFGGATNANPAALAANGINTVLEAYIAGLNPTNAQSFFSLSASQNLLQWNSISGRVYSVFWTTNLMDSFQSLATNLFYPQNSWTDLVHGAENEGFYRIKVQLGQ